MENGYSSYKAEESEKAKGDKKPDVVYNGGRMSEKEVSKWQFIDKYYDFLIEMYKSIRFAYHIEDYEMAFKDMEQIFIQMHEEIRITKGGEKKILDIKEIVETIHILKNELGLLALENTPEEIKIEDMTLLKAQLRQQTSELYIKLTTIMTELNMFMPKLKIDERLPIYK